MSKYASLKKVAGPVMDRLVPTGQHLQHYLQKFGPTSVAAGAGAAGLVEIIAAINRAKKEKEQQAAGVGSAPETLVVPIPGKTAGAPGVPPPNYLFDSAMVAGSAVVPGAITYKLLHSWFQNKEKERLRSQVDTAKTEYAGLLSNELFGGKTASVYPVIDSLVKTASMMLSRQIPLQKNADVTPVSAATSMPALLALIAAAGSHQFMYNRQKELEDLYTQKKMLPPKNIKFVTQPAANQPPKEEEELPKLANLLMNSTLAASLANAATDLKGKMSPEGLLSGTPAPKEEAPAEANAPGTIRNVDKNTVVVQTKDGPLTIDALDPKAMEFLAANQGQIMNSLSDVYTK